MPSKFRPQFVTIRHNAKVIIPWRWCFVDCGTLPEVLDSRMQAQRFQAGHATFWSRARKKRADKVDQLSFTDRLVFWKEVVKLPICNEPAYLVAFRAQFHMLALDGYRILAKLGWTLQSLYVKNSVTILRFQHGRKRLFVIDVRNFFNVTMPELAHDVGLPLATNEDLAVDLPDVLAVCQAHAAVIHRLFSIMFEWLQEGDLGSWSPTGASLSHHIFRHKFMKHEIRTHHVPAVVELERRAYVGGYVNVWRLKPSIPPPYYQLDVNSMYVSIMAEHEFPCRFVTMYQHIGLDALPRFLEKYQVIAEVLIDTNQPRYPVHADQYIPLRTDRVDREENLWASLARAEIFYPVGQFWTVLCTGSLQYALKHRHIKAVDKCALYRHAPIFRDYALWVHAQRLAARQGQLGAYDRFYKLLGNSLYGKMAQINEEASIVGQADPDRFQEMPVLDYDTGERSREVELGGSVFVFEGDTEGYYSFPAIAAHVTDYGRLKIMDLADRATTNHRYYCDSDSLIVDSAGKINLAKDIDPDRLGALKVIGQSDLYVALAKKDIVFGDDVKRKGFTDPDVTRSFQSSQVEQNLGLRNTMHEHSPDAPLVLQISKLHNPSLSNAKLTRDGRVLPLELPDDTIAIGRRIYTKHWFLDNDNQPLWRKVLSRFLK